MTDEKGKGPEEWTGGKDMYRQLIDHLAFTYSFICKGRGKVKEEDLVGIADGAHAIVKNAPAVLGGEDERAEDRADLAEAMKMDEHIEDMIVFLQHLEIV